MADLLHARIETRLDWWARIVVTLLSFAFRARLLNPERAIDWSASLTQRGLHYRRGNGEWRRLGS